MLIIIAFIGCKIFYSRYADKINSTFKEILGIQFVLSGILISVDIFQLATQKMDIMKTLFTVMYWCSLLIELMYFCIAASEVRDKVIKFTNRNNI